MPVNTPTTASDLIRAVGLMADGPAVLGRPVRASGPGVYIVELAAPLPTAPIDINRIGKWIERVPGLRLDGERPTSKALAARLAAYWLPGTTVVYVGSSASSIAGRLASLDRHVLGDPRPHAASQWLKTVRLEGLRVWWAATAAPEEYEDALFDAFAGGLAAADVAGLHDRSVVLPFANLRRGTGDRKAHGLTGSVIPLEPTAEPIPTRVVDLPPGDADGARVAGRGSGTTRRTAKPGTTPRARAATPRAAAAPRTAASRLRPAADPVFLTAEGLDNLRAELDDLARVQRPQVIARIARARELGDLKENSDYTAAREEQSFLEGRVLAIEAQVRAAVVIEAPSDTTRVVMGSRVTLEIDGVDLVLTIVGTTESDPGSGRISHASPVGKALIGRSVGEEAIVRTPGGEARYLVRSID